MGLKKCDACNFRYDYELDKPCIVYREDCPFYEKRGDDMPHSLRVRLKNLQRKGELTDKDIDRIFKALEQEPNCPYYVIDDDGHGLCKNHRVLEQESCDDAVSRQAVLNEFYDVENLYERIKQLPPINPQEPIYYPPCEDCHNKMDEIRKAYDKVQSAEPKTGHWIYKNLKGQFCSVCDEQSIWKFNYCPNCGSKMVEPQETGDKE